jgi:predicted O-methyltransferase YrrM
MKENLMKIVWREIEEKFTDALRPNQEEWEKICLVGQGNNNAPHGLILYNLVRSLRPRRIFEIGTARGFSALVMAAAQRDSGLLDGKVLTVDVIPHDRPWNWHNPRRHSKWDPASCGPISRKELLEDFDYLIDGKIEFICGKSLEVLSSIEDSTMDFVFVDGDHRYNQVLDDWKYVRRIITPEASVAFDDYDIGRYKGETFLSMGSRGIRMLPGIGKLSSRIPLLRSICRDATRMEVIFLMYGVRLVVDSIYEQGGWDLELFPYSGTLSVALLKSKREKGIVEYVL